MKNGFAQSSTFFNYDEKINTNIHNNDLQCCKHKICTICYIKNNENSKCWIMGMVFPRTSEYWRNYIHIKIANTENNVKNIDVSNDNEILQLDLKVKNISIKYKD